MTERRDPTAHWLDRPDRARPAPGSGTPGSEDSAAEPESETLTGEPVLDGGDADRDADARGADRSDRAAAGRRRRTASDPRDRPPDPAGTQPKYDPNSLLPAAEREPVALLGSSFAPAFPETAAGSGGSGLGSGPPSGPLAAAAAPSEALVPAGDGGELAAPLPPSRHAPRFQFLLGALGAITAAAVAIAVAIISAPAPAPAPAWSSWHPISGDEDPAQQIADHVAPEYKLDDGHQIVQVNGGPLSLGGQPAELALRTSGSQPALLPGNDVIYALSGSGPNGSIGEGTPSTQRLLLLRREALELALYTFRYVSGVSQVVVTVPPPPPSGASAAAGSSGSGGSTGSSGSSGSAGSSASGSGALGSAATTAGTTPDHALLFRPQDVAAELDRPLNMSLATRTPTVSTVAQSSDASLVNQLTLHNLYDYSLVQDSQSNPVLLLQPPGLGG